MLLDRQSFPRDKICGDAVSLGAIRILNDLGMSDRILAARNRGEFYRLDGMRLVSPSGHTLYSGFQRGPTGEESYVAPRLFFDAVIQQHAVDSGAKFLQAEVKAPLIDNGTVVGVQARENGEVKAYRSRVVVGADGVTSTIMRAGAGTGRAERGPVPLVLFAIALLCGLVARAALGAGPSLALPGVPEVLPSVAVPLPSASAGRLTVPVAGAEIAAFLVIVGARYSSLHFGWGSSDRHGKFGPDIRMGARVCRVSVQQQGGEHAN